MGRKGVDLLLGGARAREPAEKEASPQQVVEQGKVGETLTPIVFRPNGASLSQPGASPWEQARKSFQRQRCYRSLFRGPLAVVGEGHAAHDHAGVSRAFRGAVAAA
jgi:hypothetical protein